MCVCVCVSYVCVCVSYVCVCVCMCAVMEGDEAKSGISVDRVGYVCVCVCVCGSARLRSGFRGMLGRRWMDDWTRDM